LVPTLIGMTQDEGSVGSLARAQTQFGSFMRVIGEIQQDLAGVVNHQIIPQLCDLNFPSLTTYPQFRFLPLPDEQRLQVMSTWAQLVGAGIVGRIEDDEQHIRKVLGFPENEEPVLQPMPKTSPSEEGQPPAAGEEQSPPAGAREIPPEEQTAEMRAFALQTGGVWYAMPGGGAVCYAEESL
jgi:hypothetical protein